MAASADPYFYNYGYSGLVHHTPYVYKPLGYHAYSPGVSHTVLNKREAEPFYGYYGYPSTYSHVYSHGVYSPYGVKAPGYSNDAVSPYGYAAKGRYVAHSAGVTHIAKREADPYMLYNYMPTVYSAPAVHYSTPYVHSAYPYVSGMKTYSNDAVSPWNYAAKGKYHADSLGAKHIAKREAEPFYGYYNAYPHTYSSGHTVITSPLSYVKYFH